MSSYTCSGSFSRAFSEIPHPLYTLPTCTHTHSYWPKSCREFKREMTLLFPALWTGTFIGQGEETKSFSDQVRGQVSLSSAALQLHLMVETRHRQTVLCSLMLKGTVCPRFKILSSFTSSNPYWFYVHMKHKRRRSAVFMLLFNIQWKWMGTKAVEHQKWPKRPKLINFGLYFMQS